MIGKPDPVAGEIVKAFVALRPGRRADRGPAAASSSASPAGGSAGGRAQEIAFDQHLPHTRSGKIMRRLLKARELGLPEGDLSTLERDADDRQPTARDASRRRRAPAGTLLARRCCASGASRRRCVELYSAAQDPRLPAPLHRRGGRRGRRHAGARRRTTRSSPPTASTATRCPRRRRRARSWPRCTARRPAAAAAAAARCTCSTPPRRFYGGNAIVGRRAAAGRRAGARRQDAGPRRRHRVLLRRRRRRRGRVPRGAQPRRAVAAAGAVLLREQPLRDGHRARPLGVRRPTSRCKAAAYEMPAWAVDGMDVLAVEDAARRAVDAVRAGGGPYFLELRTYRFRAHSMYDPERYRDKAEIEPLEASATRSTLLRAALQADGQLTDEDWTQLRGARSPPRSTHAVAFAEAGTARAGRGPDPLRLQRGGAATATSDRETTYREAMREAIREALRARRAGVPDGRGRRPLRRLLRGEPGAARGVRARAGPRHPAVGVGVRRRRHRRGARRDAADRRDHDRQLQPARARPDPQQRRDAAAHVRRPVQRARW